MLVLNFKIVFFTETRPPNLYKVNMIKATKKAINIIDLIITLVLNKITGIKKTKNKDER